MKILDAIYYLMIAAIFVSCTALFMFGMAGESFGAELISIDLSIRKGFTEGQIGLGCMETVESNLIDCLSGAIKSQQIQCVIEYRAGLEACGMHPEIADLIADDIIAGLFELEL